MFLRSMAKISRLPLRQAIMLPKVKQAVRIGSITGAVLSTSFALQQVMKNNIGYTLPEDVFSQPKWKAQKPTTDLEQVACNTEVMNSFSDIVTYLQDPQKFIESGIQAPRGVILSGPPGVGKTMMAEAIAGQAGVPVIIISGPEVLNPFVGGTEDNLRKLFEIAKQSAPCILCIDEIDAIASKRSSNAERSHDKYLNAQVDQLLSLLSQNHPGVIVIGTTNDFKKLDPAVVRQGRFDKHIYISLPDLETRLRLLEIYTKNKRLDSKVSLDELAKLSAGFSGAKIAAWINQAAISATQEGNNNILLSDFDKARDIVENGANLQPQTDIKQKMITAKHESGHALVAHHLGLKLYKISLLKSGKAYGFNQYLPPDEDSNLSKDEALNFICVFLAGRAAEELFGEPRVGCQSDFEKAKDLAVMMVQEGMGSTLSGASVTLDVENILREQSKRAKNILLEHKNEFDNLVPALMQHNELHHDAFLNAIAGKPIKPSQGLFSSFFGETAKPTTKPKNLLPPKKAYKEPPSLPLNHTQDTPVIDTGLDVKSGTPFSKLSIEEIAKVLGVKAHTIRNIQYAYDGGIEIKFKPSFDQSNHMESMSKQLKQHDVENIFMSDPHFKTDIRLHIYGRGLEDFIEYVKKQNNKDDDIKKGRRP